MNNEENVVSLTEAIVVDTEHIRHLDFEHDPAAYDEYISFADIKTMHLAHLATLNGLPAQESIDANSRTPR